MKIHGNVLKSIGPDEVARPDVPQTQTHRTAAVGDIQPGDGAIELDAGRPDAHMPDVSAMSAFDRDEAAKDEVDVAREALDDGELELAAAAIARARLYDDGNSDIPALEDRLDALRAAGE